MAAAPMYYFEDLSEEVEQPHYYDEDDGSVRWSKVILHHARLQVCKDLTKEQRIAQGCRNMARYSRLASYPCKQAHVSIWLGSPVLRNRARKLL